MIDILTIFIKQELAKAKDVKSAYNKCQKDKIIKCNINFRWYVEYLTSKKTKIAKNITIYRFKNIL